MKHEHKFHFVEEIPMTFSSLAKKWIPNCYKFVCECGEVKYVKEKEKSSTPTGKQ